MKAQLIKMFLATLTGIVFISQMSFGQQWNGDEGTDRDIYRYGNVGIGFQNEPGISENLELYSGIRIGLNFGNNPGTIRWNSAQNKFEGRTSSNWISLMSNWNINGSSIYYNGGNVGIGTTTPGAKLQIDQGTNSVGLRLQGSPTYGALLMLTDGIVNTAHIKQTTVGNLELATDGRNIILSSNVGIGTESPTEKLQVDGNVFIKSNINSADIFRIRGSGVGQAIMVTLGSDDYNGGVLRLKGENITLVELNASGTSFINGPLAVGKETPSAGYKFDVAGKIRADEIVVDIAGDFPDFVFEEDYHLRPISEVETFIKANKHLPEIPTAKEVEENGVSLGEMQSLLLQKIEELTLYTIEQDKRIKELESK